MSKVKLIYDSTEGNSDLFYATHFWAPDDFIFLEKGGKKYIVVSELEIDRAKVQADVDEVLPISRYIEKASAKLSDPGIVDVICELLKDMKIKSVEMPAKTPFTIVDALKNEGVKVSAGSSPFFSERYIKTAQEVKFITDAQKNVFAAMAFVRDILKKSKIKNNKLVLSGKALTSENVRQKICIFLLERGYSTVDPIVSCGKHAIDPHSLGSGYLRPHQSIIVDIFPKSIKTFYYGDATRTFCKGKAPDSLKKMYAVVKKGQELGISMVKAGVDGKDIHFAIMDYFKDEGYPTEERKGRQVGFFHGTGHGIGLDLHEEPSRINKKSHKIREGLVTSVEPGLYYPEIGGVRIEDLVYVTKTGCKILSSFPKKLEIV